MKGNSGIMKKYISLVICILLIFSCNVCAEEEISSPQRLLYLNADDVGSKIGSSQVPRTIEFNGRKVFDHDFSVSGSLYYIPWVRTDSNMDTNKKYIYHAEYYPDFDTPTGYVEGMWLNISGTDISGIEVTPKGNSHPFEDGYRYYSYYYKNGYTDLYTTGFFNGFINDDLSASNSGSWPWKSNEMVLKTRQWNTYELVLTKPLDSKFQIYPFVSSKFGNGISGGDRIYFDDAYLEELALGKIELNKNGSSLVGKTLKTKQNYEVAFWGEVFNQFDSTLGFKDRHGRVMEPLKFEIYNEDGELISTSFYGESPTNTDIYVETQEYSYKLKASKDGKTTWDIPTYNFNIKTSENVQIGTYIVKASLLNDDIFGSEKYTEFNLEVLSENSYTSDETEPETLIWLIGDDEENKVGNDLTVSYEKGKNNTAGYIFDFSKADTYNVVCDSDKSMSAEKKYIYTADYSSDSDILKIILNGEETDFNLKSGEWKTFEQLISDNASEVFTVSHTATTGEKPIVYADNIRMQELSVGSIALSETPKSIVRNHQFDFSCVLFNQFGTETGFLGEELQFDIYSSVGNHIGESKFSDGENKTSGNITVSAKTITQNGALKPTNEYTVNISSATVSDTYTVVASLCDKNIHNSDLTASFDIKVTKEKNYPKGDKYPQTLLWANGDDASFGRSLGEVVYNKGVDGTNAYKQTFEKDGGTYYLKPYPHTELMTDPSKKYIYHADYYVDFETSNGKTTTNWMLWSSADDEGLRVTKDSGEHPSNEDYRYYSYYPGFAGTDVYVKGVFKNIINPDLTMSDSVWNASNMFVLKQKKWTTYEALVSKQEIKRFNVYGLFGKSNDDVIGKPVYIDNVCFQELALGDIELYSGAVRLDNNDLRIKRGEIASINAEVYNQFGSTLGFKDREGRVMEPLRFTVYDECGNIISENDFKINNTEIPFGISFETKRNEYNLLAPKNGMEKWVYPTYDFSLNISDEFPCGEYKVVAKLQNEDIFGSEKTVGFDLVIEENSSALDFEILGESEIIVPTEGHKSVTYTNSIEEIGEWRLQKGYAGVSVSKDGVLCVENIAEHGDIYLICEINKDGKKYLSSKRIVISGEIKLSIENNSIYSVKLTDNTYFNYNRYLNIFSKDGSFIKSELVPQGLENYGTALNDNEIEVKLFVWDENMKPYSSVLKANADNLPLNIYVSVDGDDNNSGTFDKPLKTPQAARDMIRKIKAQGAYPEKGINVIFREGTYRITDSLKLEKHDSGTVNSPITYKAFENEKVIFSGADSLPSDKWNVVTDSEALSKIPSNAHGKVYEIDLGKLGYTADDIGQMNYWGIFANNNNQSDTPKLTAPAELYSDGEPQVVARYPNEGYINIQKVYNPGGQWYNNKTKNPFEIGYEDERTERWGDAKYAKLFGYWVYDYAESSVDIAKIDTEKKSITSKQTTAFGVKAYDGVGGRYYIFNLLEELDTPGEYYTDLDTLKLYYYPKGNISDTQLKLSVFDDTLLNAYEASNVTFENIQFSDTRPSGIWIQNCTNFKIKGCEICNFGSEAVVIYEGTDNSVSDSRIYNVTGGINLVSNNGRETLTKSNNSAVNNEIYNFARSSRSSIPAITVNGCGNYVAKNTIHNGPHEGIWLLSANENIVEYNELYDLLNDTSDAGAIYCGHDWTQRGNIIRYNHIYDLGNGQENIEGIYLDETVSGYDIYSNIVGGYYGDGILINGGSDVLIHDNIFYNLGKRNLFMRYWADKSQGQARMNNVLSSPFRNDIWKEKYPNLYNIMDSDPFFPQYCTVKNNISIDNPKNEIQELVKEFSEVEDLVNVTSDKVTICDENGNLNIDFEKIKEFIPDFNSFDFNNIGSTIAIK